MHCTGQSHHRRPCILKLLTSETNIWTLFLAGVQRHNNRCSGLWCHCWCWGPLQCYERLWWVSASLLRDVWPQRRKGRLSASLLVGWMIRQRTSPGRSDNKTAADQISEWHGTCSTRCLVFLRQRQRGHLGPGHLKEQRTEAGSYCSIQVQLWEGTWAQSHHFISLEIIEPSFF